MDTDDNTKQKEMRTLHVISKYVVVIRISTCVHVEIVPCEHIYIRIEWMKLKKIYKELQKKQMSQLKETMKQQPNTGKDDSNAAMEDEQDVSVEDSTKPLVDTCNCDDNTVMVEITMATLLADEVEVRTYPVTIFVQQCL